MKAEKGMKCVICSKPAVERAFDNTAWCTKHLESWKEFYKNSGMTIDQAFREWLETQN